VVVAVVGSQVVGGGGLREYHDADWSYLLPLPEWMGDDDYA